MRLVSADIAEVAAVKALEYPWRGLDDHDQAEVRADARMIWRTAIAIAAMPGQFDRRLHIPDHIARFITEEAPST